MLRIEHLSCGYGGTPVVRDVSFRVGEGERLCILGPNGCGKTTLLRALAGLLPSQGVIELGGADLRALPARQRAKKLALMSQLSPAAFDYTVLLLDRGSVLACESMENFDLAMLDGLYGMDVRDYMKTTLKRWI